MVILLDYRYLRTVGSRLLLHCCFLGTVRQKDFEEGYVMEVELETNPNGWRGLETQGEIAIPEDKLLEFIERHQEVLCRTPPDG